MLETIVQQLFNALSLASIYIIIALGLQVIFGLMGIINLAHGEFLLLGAYTVFVLQNAGFPFGVALLVAIIVAIVLGFVIEKSIIRFLYDKPEETLLVTWGLSIVLREIAKLIFGPSPKPLAMPISNGLEIGSFIFPYWRLIIILASIVTVGLLHYLLYKTDTGLKIRSTLENSDLSMSMGINIGRMYLTTFVIGSTLAAIAGAIVIPLSAVSPDTGLVYLLPSFLVVIIGGIGSFKGVVYAGLFIGGLSGLLTFIMSSVTAEILVFFMVIVLLRFKKDGDIVRNI